MLDYGDYSTTMTESEPDLRRPTPSAGPVSMLGTCAECGKKNKFRPAERGSPHCGSCGEPLPWLVERAEPPVALEARSSVSDARRPWAPWCGPCRVVGPMLENLSKEYAGRIKVVKVNVDENPALAQQFGARSIPTMIVIRATGSWTASSGPCRPSDLKMRLFPYLMKS